MHEREPISVRNDRTVLVFGFIQFQPGPAFQFVAKRPFPQTSSFDS